MRKNDTIFPHIIYCISLRLKEKESLSYLSDKGYDISRIQYYRLKKEIEESTHERLNLVASEEFLSQHLERLDTLRMIHDELIENYKKETNPTRKSNILMQLAEIQQYLTAFYDSTRYVMEQAARMKPLAESAEQLKKKKRKLQQEEQH